MAYINKNKYTPRKMRNRSRYRRFTGKAEKQLRSDYTSRDSKRSKERLRSEGFSCGKTWRSKGTRMGPGIWHFYSYT